MQPNAHISARAIDAITSAGQLYEVGGTVRDSLFELPNAGIDRDYLVTGIPLKELTKILRKTGKVDVVGRSFGVIKYTEFPDNETPRTFDIALPRVEESVGVGHKDFEVNFDPEIPIEDDLKRRDFTINAMARSVPDGRLIDPCGGAEDVKRRALRIVFPDSFKEDPLRLMRAIQFAARFDLEVETDTWNAMSEQAALVKTVSPERIAEELNKLLNEAANPSAGFRMMRDTGLLEFVLPEMIPSINCDQPGGFHRWNVFEHTLRVIDAVRPELRLRLAALFHDINKPQAKRPNGAGVTFYGHETTGARTAKRVMRRLRYSNQLTNEVSMLVERHMFTTGVSDKGLRRLVKRVGVDLIFDLLDLRRADVVGQGMGGVTDDVDEFEANIRAELERKPPFSRSDLALNGRQVMDIFDLHPGPRLGEVLDHLLEKVLDNPEDNTPETLTELAKAFLNSDSTDLDE